MSNPRKHTGPEIHLKWECSSFSQTPLSQDDELAVMVGYAAAMDASMSEGNSTQDVTTAIVSGASSLPEESEPMEGPSGIGRPPEDWESQAAEELDHSSLSMCVSEANCKKSRGERPPTTRTGYLQPQVTPGMVTLVCIDVLFKISHFKNILPERQNLNGLHEAVFMAICSSVMQSVFCVLLSLFFLLFQPFLYELSSLPS